MNGTDYAKFEEYFNNLSVSAKVCYFVLAAVVCILSIVAMWKIFVKAGQAGWKSLIPFYTVYTLFKICWNSKYFWIYLVSAFATGALSGASAAFAVDSVGNIIFLVLSAVVAIYLIYLDVVLAIKLAKAFGHGVGFGIGLIFLEFIFTLILAFDDSKYVGNPDEIENQKN